MTRITANGNKYGSIRTWSELCQRTFDSKAEAKRGEELALLELAGVIRGLAYQCPFRLCEHPKITVTVDFVYRVSGDTDEENGRYYFVHEDVKGVLTRDFRTKLAWLKEKYGIDVKLVRRE
jgi:hypothetical protein